MALDAICLMAVKEELRGRIIGMKVDKVRQPERDIIILSLRGGDAPPCNLLISSGTGDARLHLTEYKFENPGSPPMFCMLLRKHITGARITDITQPPAERVLDLALEAKDAMGLVSEKHLIVELIGRSSNIILTDDGGMIIGCVRHNGGEPFGKRYVLPGLIYHPPPTQQGKQDPLSVSAEKWRELFSQHSEKQIDAWLLANFAALSPLICREILWRAYGELDLLVNRVNDGGEALCTAFFTLMEQAGSGKFEPWMIIDFDNSPRDFSYTRITQYESSLDIRRYESFSKLLDEYYTRSAQILRQSQRAAATSRTVSTARDRLIRKLSLQREELNNTNNRDWYRECGDIIMANLHLMKKGHSVLRAEDFYSEDGGWREIALDTRKSPKQNAEKYYKDYSKAKNALKFLSEQIQLGESELEYLSSVLEEIKLTDSESGLSEIRSELMRTGYIKSQKSAKDKPVESEPTRFESSTGMRIFAGRNNTQNDKLTLKAAARSDIWLHAQKSHGAHVIISCDGEPPDAASLNEAASIAAYYSSARDSGKTPVDYTLVKHVKRRPGGRPGMVIYTDYKTIIATPDEELVSRLKK
ncbi:MAG: NFACT family protein [Oscillospiraceae bacterium]|nr:NFACT family protein [Oscillospiraceae bacterium]